MTLRVYMFGVCVLGVCRLGACVHDGVGRTGMISSNTTLKKKIGWVDCSYDCQSLIDC
jgi:hypothetical protein